MTGYQEGRLHPPHIRSLYIWVEERGHWKPEVCLSVCEGAAKPPAGLDRQGAPACLLFFSGIFSSCQIGAQPAWDGCLGWAAGWCGVRMGARPPMSVSRGKMRRGWGEMPELWHSPTRPRTTDRQRTARLLFSISNNRVSDKPHWLRYCHCTKLN